jgi:putative ABC transport system ATP-binding protein
MTAVVSMRGVRKTFAHGTGEMEILHGVDLDVAGGDFVAIVGRSGSGKTTCLEIMGSLSRPSAGTCHLVGRPVHALDDDTLADLRAAHVGFVFQTFNLMPRMDAVRNVALPLLYAGVPRREREARAERLLERVGLDQRADHLPSEMSGGERQRVAIARALANDPQVIFADEPTGNLDKATSDKIVALLGELHREGRTLVLVTHSDEIAERATRIVRLLDGRVVADERRADAADAR